MRWVPLVSMLGLWVAFTHTASANAPVVPPPSTEAPKVPAAPEYDDYRLTLLGVDAVAISLVAGGVYVSGHTSLSTPLILAGVGTYAFGGPLVHLSNGQHSRAVESLALRLGLPLGSLLMGVVLSTTCPPSDIMCPQQMLGVGLVLANVGVLTAMIIDDVFLGKAIRTSPYGETPSPSAFRLGVAPLLEPRRKARGLSLVGAF